GYKTCIGPTTSRNHRRPDCLDAITYHRNCPSERFQTGLIIVVVSRCSTSDCSLP
ncbi:hypothetical protein K1T71_008398, partial [Dendrolimus kikuchii]